MSASSSLRVAVRYSTLTDLPPPADGRPDNYPRSIVDRSFERSPFLVGVFQRRRPDKASQVIVNEKPIFGDRELVGIGRMCRPCHNRCDNEGNGDGT